MALPAPTREKLRELLSIPCTGSKEVSTTGGEGSVLVSDGVTAVDLAIITREKLLKFLKAKDGEFPALWVETVKKADISLSVVGAEHFSTGDSAVTTKKDEETKPTETPEVKSADIGGRADKPEGEQAADTPA